MKLGIASVVGILLLAGCLYQSAPVPAPVARATSTPDPRPTLDELRAECAETETPGTYAHEICEAGAYDLDRYWQEEKDRDDRQREHQVYEDGE